MKTAKIAREKKPAAEQQSEKVSTSYGLAAIIANSDRELGDRLDRLINTLARIMQLAPGTRYLEVKDRDGILTGIIVDHGQSIPARLVKRYGGWRTRGAKAGNKQRVKTGRKR